MINGDDALHNFDIQNTTMANWGRVIDTSLQHPEDFKSTPEGLKQKNSYAVQARSIVVLQR